MGSASRSWSYAFCRRSAASVASGAFPARCQQGDRAVDVVAGLLGQVRSRSLPHALSTDAERHRDEPAADQAVPRPSRRGAVTPASCRPSRAGSG